MKNYSLLLSITLLLISCDRQTETQNGSDSLKTGADVLVEQNFEPLYGYRVGIITNHTATSGGRHIVDLIHEHESVDVIALFGPEHGIRGDAPAGELIDFETDEATGLPVHSLYGEIRKPTPEMLEGIDLLIFDIQDIGPRFYTYISTMGMAMEAAAENEIGFVVLDRPNPLGGELVEGFVREEGFESFVGYYPIPVTHGLTLGELAIMAKEEGMLDGIDDLELQIIEVENWERGKYWSELNRDWNPPSPNIPDFETALVYPGACFFEGTNASEGRGTQEPFILVGAPWAEAEAIAGDLNGRELPGVRFEPVTFKPESIPGMAMNPKHEGSDVHGVRHVVTDESDLRPVETGIHLLHAFYTYAPENERDNLLDQARLGRLAGTDRLYNMLMDGASASEIIESWSDELQEFDTMRRQYFLY